MKTKLQIELRKIAPSFLISTIWEHDQDCRDIRKDCDGMDDEDPDDWQAWRSEICVAIIREGERVTHSAYLGGTWEKAGDVPEESNPTISGYENQMTVEALEGVAKQLPADDAAQAEIVAAIAYIEAQP